MTQAEERTSIDFPQARCRAAVARIDITPPVGIYHRMWGAATHDRATGVHRPLFATALVLESMSHANDRQAIVAIDHCLMWAKDMHELRRHVRQSTGLPDDQLHIAFSHTHAAGLMDSSRAELPGGELIAPYLESLASNIAKAVNEAVEALQPATIVYGTGRCDLAAHRDFWDAESQQFACGFNPAGPTDDTVMLARIDADSGAPIAVIVNYACHPTTLAWDNTLISPDYVGALRDIVEQAHGGLCMFLQGASGDIGPREGYVGDPAVADRNGRQLGYAVLSALEALPKAGQRYEYSGPVISGATIGAWRYGQPPDKRERRAALYRSHQWTIDLLYRADLPTFQQAQSELVHWEREERLASQAGNEHTARDCHAQVERMNRQITRLGQLPAGSTFPLTVKCFQIGDAYWILLEGEYYNLLQRALRERFPDTPILVATVVDGWRPAYLPTRETYCRGIYQEQVAVLAPGSLEAVIESVTTQIAQWQNQHV